MGYGTRRTLWEVRFAFAPNGHTFAARLCRSVARLAFTSLRDPGVRTRRRTSAPPAPRLLYSCGAFELSLPIVQPLRHEALRPLSALRLRHMRILLSDPEPISDLVSYLRRCGCRAEIAGRGAVEAAPPERPLIDDAYLRMELDAYLRVWREMHPAIKAELVDSPNGEPIAL